MEPTYYDEEELEDYSKVEIALVEHPISKKLKATLKAKGYKIIDIKHRDRIDPKLVVEIVVKTKPEDKVKPAKKKKEQE